MALIDGRARILQFLKVDDDLVERDALKVRHGSPPPAPVSWKPHRGRYTQRLTRAQALHFTKLTYKCALALGSCPTAPRAPRPPGTAPSGAAGRAAPAPGGASRPSPRS